MKFLILLIVVLAIAILIFGFSDSFRNIIGGLQRENSIQSNTSTTSGKPQTTLRTTSSPEGFRGPAGKPGAGFIGPKGNPPNY